MTDRNKAGVKSGGEIFKNALDGIHADEALKRSAAEFLRKKIYGRGKTQTRFKFAAAFVFAAVLFFTGASVYLTPGAYVDIDINPSFEITLNRFGRVIKTYAYNPEGEQILGGINILNASYNSAVSALVDASVENGYAERDGTVSVTLQTVGGENERAMLAEIENAVQSCHGISGVEAYAVGGEVKTASHDLNLSPAKYSAIQELLTVDPTATVEGCRNHSVNEIKRQAMEHHGMRRSGMHGSHHG